ncbi:YitT family protein [Capnocytophaga sp.]|uniref:YitT family protein n=1 Tax=Capnocytophaga sp. TaxID=44737 RepID=UPI0026DAFB33|nr:YitT family protein [Capnocytophaga sp.]MDO5104895.1 YitT family protein [Capnocytophaga sp.]
MLKNKTSSRIKYLKSFYIKDYLIIVIGLVLFTIGLTGFILPNRIVTGGLSGISIIIKYVTHIELWKTNLVVNGVLLAIAFRAVSKQYVIRTLVGIGLLSLMLSFGETYLQPYFSENPPVSEPFLSTIVGGVFCGTGLGLVFSVNGSTGGTDIIGALVTKYYRISLSRILLIVDVLIVTSSYFILDGDKETLERTIFGLILLPLMWQMVEIVINGARQSVQLFIFSKHYDEIATHINTEIKRGCTIIDGIGWYSQTPQKVIIVIARRTEATSIFRLVGSIDPEAFVTKATVMGVYGKGFDKLK